MNVRRIVSSGVAVLLLSASMVAAQSAEAPFEAVPLGERTMLSSDVLGEERPILVYTPDGYESSDESYTVLYLLDGGPHFLHVAGVTDFLSKVRRIPPMIVVAVDNVPGERGRAYNMSPPSEAPTPGPAVGGASDFLEFLRDELQPWVEERYRTLPYRVLTGHSLGGLFATHVLIEDPEAFDAYISISPSLWWDAGNFVEGATSIFEDRPRLRSSLYMTMGDEDGAMLAGAWRLTGILETMAPETFRWTWRRMPDETHGSVPHRSIYHGLEWIFDGWWFTELEGLVALEEDAGLRALERHYSDLSARLGLDLPVPAQVIDQLGIGLVREQRFEDALVVHGRAVDLYPDSWLAHDHLADALRMLCRVDEARGVYARAYELAEADAIPVLEQYRAELDQISLSMEEPSECVVPGSEPDVQLPEDLLDEYVGSYELRPDFVLEVSRDGSEVFLAVPGRPLLAMTAKAEGRFALSQGNVEVVFERDDSAKVVELVLRQPGGEQRARKLR